ncbi:MAG: nucleotidyltransferase family protein [Candidatus Bipolaricaulota bacterium]|nr:nucleotidyltransferase family protein [Candidatus Bipolaricaulota bacterium]
MSAKEEILEKLKALKPELQVHYKVRELGLFGSFVRGEQHEASDVDILVDFTEDASLFDLVRLADFLEEKLQRRVDIVTKDSLRVELRESVLRETVTI